MSFYLRKSISVGPLRFNLSKSGIGVSAGIKGLRFGAGPRGNYVHMGRNGLYYRAAIPSSPSSSLPGHRLPQASNQQLPSNTHAPLEEIESAHVSKIVDSSSRELLEELKTKRAKLRLWPAALAATGLISLFGMSVGWSVWLQGLLFLGGMACTYVAHSRDVLAKTVVLFYEFDAEMEAAYEQLHRAAGQLASCAAAWHIEASGKVRDRKYHAGASELVRRKRTFIRKAEPPYVKTNIETVAVGVGQQILHFFPDRVLVYAHDGVGAVGYPELSVDVGAMRFIEAESVPRDAEIVDQTWKYVNKSGGPDRRFKDNRQIPICRYEEITLTSQSGLNELIQVSRCGFGTAFSEAVVALGKKMPKEG